MDDMFDDVEDNKESEAGKTELEYHLSDAREDRKNASFNILHWWRVAGSKYKVVSVGYPSILKKHNYLLKEPFIYHYNYNLCNLFNDN